MDNQTLGAAIAICGKQIEGVMDEVDEHISEAIEGIIGTLDEVVVSVVNNKLVITEKEGEE